MIPPESRMKCERSQATSGKNKSQSVKTGLHFWLLDRLNLPHEGRTEGFRKSYFSRILGRGIGEEEKGNPYIPKLTD